MPWNLGGWTLAQVVGPYASSYLIGYVLDLEAVEYAPIRGVPRLGGVAADTVGGGRYVPARQGGRSTTERGGSTVKHGQAVLVLLTLDSVLGEAPHLGVSLGGYPGRDPVGHQCLDTDHGRGDGEERVAHLLRVVEPGRLGDFLGGELGHADFTPGLARPLVQGDLVAQVGHDALELPYLPGGRNDHRKAIV
jgi:hypothetical protein